MHKCYDADRPIGDVVWTASFTFFIHVRLYAAGVKSTCLRLRVYDVDFIFNWFLRGTVKFSVAKQMMFTVVEA